MIRVTVDLSDATDMELILFYGLPGVGRALDSIAHDTELVQLDVRSPPTGWTPAAVEVSA